ncbi:substrate-binding domain-containing protein [Halomonas sp. ND22Bw]|uniref:substrate-binding domain-containing protein n=1 Tax=Halomonas sp. ND22Bw TaxID=2054178 RepID=UPI0034E0D97D
MAGFHLPRGQVGKRLSRGYRDQLKPRSYRLIRFITRRQGLIVAPRNPLGVKG